MVVNDHFDWCGNWVNKIDMTWRMRVVSDPIESAKDNRKQNSRVWSTNCCPGGGRRCWREISWDFMSRKWHPPGFHVPYVPSTFSTILNEMCRSGLHWLGLRAFQGSVAHPGQEESRRSECEHSDVVLEIDGTDNKVAKLHWQKNAS